MTIVPVPPPGTAVPLPAPRVVIPVPTAPPRAVAAPVSPTSVPAVVAPARPAATPALTPPAAREEATSKPVNPHWKEALCTTCHSKDAGGKPLGTKLLDASERANCNRCHPPSRMATMAHAYDLKASPIIHVPTEWPLSDGLVGCETCHDILKQCLGKLKDRWRNPQFLRRTESETDLDFCFKCHERQLYQTESPHDQLDAQGQFRKQVCLYCHKEVPDVNKAYPPGWSDLKARMTDLCGNCHGVFPHPLDIPHLVPVTDQMLARMNAYDVKDQYQIAVQELERYLTGVKRLPRSMPLDPQTHETACNTCHNPHEKGVLPASSPLARGAEGKTARNYRLRLPREEICLACHHM